MTEPYPHPARWTEDQLRDITTHLFGGGEPEPEPETPEDEAARLLKGNHVPLEGSIPARPADSAEMRQRRFVRALLGADENYTSMDAQQ